MSRRRFITLGVLSFVLAVASVNLFADDLAFTGYVRNYTGILLDNDTYSSDYSNIQNTFDLKADYSSDIGLLHAEGYVYSNGDNSLTAGMRELYLDLSFNTVDLRIGKQQIIWGKADGLFITDVISPKDLTNYILPDFDEVRIGVNSVKADYYIGDFTIEGIWVPVFTPSIAPEKGSLWYVTPDLPPNVKPTIESAVLPSATFENSETFAKISYMGAAFDFELLGGYMWDDTPVPQVTSFPPGATPLVDITPKYHQMLMGGASFSGQVAGFVIRGEGAYYNGKYFNLSPEALLADVSSGGNGTVEKNYLNYMGGVDYVISGVTLSTQFVQEIIFDYDDSIAANEVTNTMTFLISKQYLNDTLTLKLFSYYGITNSDGLLRFSVTYDIIDGMELVVGSDIFLGDSGNYGQYNDNDAVYTKLTYSF